MSPRAPKSFHQKHRPHARRDRDRHYNRTRRDPILERRRKSGRWQKLREQILRRDMQCCVPCRNAGRWRQARDVHHIRAAHQYPELFWEPENLVSVCRPCHIRLDREHGSSPEGPAKTSEVHTSRGGQGWESSL